MAIFCYLDEDEVGHELHFPCGEAPEELQLKNGKRAKRNRAAELYTKTAPSKRGWPMECYASGVHPNQANELRNHLQKKGVPTTVTENGDPVYESKEHRKRALRARGMFDKDAFN